MAEHVLLGGYCPICSGSCLVGFGNPSMTTPTEPTTEAGREVHTLLHRLSSQMKTCEMVPCPFAGLARRTEIQGAEARASASSVEEIAAAQGIQPIRSADDLRIEGITDDEAAAFTDAIEADGGGDLIVDLLEAWQTHIAAEHDDEDLHPGCLPVEMCLKGIAGRLPRAAAPDAELHRLIDALPCQWGISSPEECAEIGEACAPCALRLHTTAVRRGPTRPGSSRPCTR